MGERVGPPPSPPNLPRQGRAAKPARPAITPSAPTVGQQARASARVAGGAAVQGDGAGAAAGLRRPPRPHRAPPPAQPRRALAARGLGRRAGPLPGGARVRASRSSRRRGRDRGQLCFQRVAAGQQPRQAGAPRAPVGDGHAGGQLGCGPASSRPARWRRSRSCPACAAATSSSRSPASSLSCCPARRRRGCSRSRAASPSPRSRSC